jgi:hypothetical protein
MRLLHIKEIKLIISFPAKRLGRLLRVTTSLNRLQYDFDFPNGRFPEILASIIIIPPKIFGKTSIREIGFREIVESGL